MRWTPGGSSDDVEDRREESGGGGGFQIGGLHLGLTGVIILFVLSLIFRRDFLSLLSSGPAGTTGTASLSVIPRASAGAPLVQFVTFVLNDSQNTWSQILSSQGGHYRHAKLVLFRDSIDSACGLAQTATGPFYCPEDERVYIDLGFYDELKQRFGAPGEFAEAYVLAHEIGHHVQKLLGIEGRWGGPSSRTRRKATSFPSDSNCRRTASQGSGDTQPSSETSWNPETGMQACRLRRRLGTIVCSACPAAR